MAESLPRRDDVLALLTRGPLRARDLASKLHVTGNAEPGFFRFLDDLAQQGVLRLMTGHRYAVGAEASRKAAEREGTLSANARGFGFVRTPGETEDVYIHESSMAGALHGDAVRVRITGRSARGYEGEIVRVIKRGRARVAGVLRKKGKSAWLEPDDARVRGPILLQHGSGGDDGDAAVATITRFPVFADENPEGELIAVLGKPGEPRVEVAKILLREGVEEEHSEAAIAEAEAYGGRVPEDALVGREDLTAIPLPTIDPEDARDHDDAVWVERAAGGGWQVWIAIADVSEYVRPGTALDREAFSRGCSIYLPTRAIPMLPRALSSSLCSLLPDELRLCLCVIVTLDERAHITSSRIVRGFLRSRAKLTYEGVARALGFSEGEAPAEAVALLEGLRDADALSQRLRKKRLARGALDFSLPEAKVVIDKVTGEPLDVERRAQDPGVKRAYSLIEELMLLANEVVASNSVERNVPVIYRVHTPPDPTKLEHFSTLCEELGVPFDPEEAADPKRLSELVLRLAKHPRGDILSSLLLRAMKQASYHDENLGHFGLASEAYLHFTSPIRRYPDLVVHRAIKRDLAGTPHDRSEKAEEDLREAAKVASERERAVMEVEREVVNLYAALLMRKHIGSSFQGTVVSVVGSGAFVSLDAPFVEVLVSSEAMGRDMYVLDDERMRFVGRRSGDSVGLGDRITVTIEDVSIQRRMVLAWRHPPEATEGGGPLRHSPFRARSSPATTTKTEPERKAKKGTKKAVLAAKQGRRLGAKSGSGRPAAGASKKKKKKPT